MSQPDILSRLMKAYKCLPAGSSLGKGLNTTIRKSLRLYANSERLQFTQDNVGNIYITKSGRDQELAGIGIGFPLDEMLSTQSFVSAFKIFDLTQNMNLLCDVTLIGWTSVGGCAVGRGLWEGSLLNKASIDPLSEIQQFSNLPSPESFSFSALFEVIQTDSETLNVVGSPVLIEKVRRVASTEVTLSDERIEQTRAPTIRIEGSGAEKVTQDTIYEYSRYVAALFDNFD